MATATPPKPEPQKVLCIPQWFDAECGHEVSNRGRPIKSPLKWYRSAVHSGATRAQLAAKAGQSAQQGAVYLYDVLCQLIASQPAAIRGRLYNRVGKLPMTETEIARECQRQVKWVQRHIAILVEVGWLAWIPVTRRLNGAWTARQLCADGAPAARQRRANCAESGVTNKASKAEAGKQQKKVKDGIGQGEGGGGEGVTACLPASSGSTDSCCLPALPAKDEGQQTQAPPQPGGTGAPCDANPRRLLQLAGFDAEAADQVASEAGDSVALILEACEAGDIMLRHRRLKGTRQAYIRAYARAGGFRLPAGLDKYRTRMPQFQKTQENTP